MRRTPALNEVLEREGLPSPSEPASGERAVLKNTGTEALVEFNQGQQEPGGNRSL